MLKELPKNSICAEIGVYKGDFSEDILSVTRPKKLYLIDPWKYEPGEIYKKASYGGAAGSQEAMDRICEETAKKFKLEINKGLIAIHRKSSEEAGRDFPDGHFDWVYIDGNHQYEFAIKDLELYFTKVKKRGFIAGDDYRNGGWWRGGVKKAVDEFIKRGVVKKVRILGNQFILQKY